MRKGIILAGGSGSRLFPLTFSVTKQLLPIHDKPMIYYPLSTLLELDITEILIITTNHDKSQFQKLLGNGEALGISISYATQDKPNGIAEGLIIGEKFLNGESCVFILGDNLFLGSIDKKNLKNKLTAKEGATIFTYKVIDPERYGVVSFNKNNDPLEIIEKPENPLSNNAITGLYLFDKNAVDIAKKLKPSDRGELEITDVNKHYLKNKMLNIISIDKDVTWLDAGTISSLYEATNFVSTLELRTGIKIACIEEIAFTKKRIGIKDLIAARTRYGKSNYGKYLQDIINKND